ncbi:MAG: UDP-N-acetylmuramoyl-L-alanine--D-glutamate ligase [Bacteroidota bacterium]|jgi:UDP-N-acetylmuramoylalanine--D-glutamate ligase
MSKRIVVLGGAESGTGAAVLAKLQGFDVFLSDMSNIAPAFVNTLNDYGIAFEQGQHTADLICNATEIIKSPGIPTKAPIIQQIIALQIPIISEIEFASRYTNAKMIAITGTNGKTTTTLLTYHLLKNAGLNVGLAGNIGNSFAMQVATKKFDYYVLELSSFMLDDMFHFKADIAILTNITPDHLDRYDYQMQKYVSSKFRITQNQTASDYFIYCKDDEVIQAALASQQIDSTMIPFSIAEDLAYGASISNQHLNIKLKQNTFTMTIQELALQGKHNLYNSMASGVAAKLLDIRNETLKQSMSDFKNAPHRLEHVARIQGIEFINDSKATNVNSTWYALESINTPIIWIAGGVDKGNDYSMLTQLVKDRVRAIVCLGTDNSKIHEAFGNVVDIIVNTASAKEAAEVSYHLGKKGDTVLLSPACASFDLFKNYEDRGQQFMDAVKEL